MNRGLVNLEELRKNISSSSFQGKSSYCFVQGDKLIKVYAKKGDKGFFIPLNVNKICDLSKFSSDVIVFPEEYIYENNQYAGEILKYIRSKSINESFNNLANIKKIINSYELVLNDLYLYNNIDMIDLCYVNILYSNKRGFHLIDTTEWCFHENSLNKNIYRFNSSLIDVLINYLDIPIVYSKYYQKIDHIFIQNMNKYGQSGKKLKESLNLLMCHKYNFLSLLLSYLEAYRVYQGIDAETLKDIKEFTKVLKKG